MLMMSYRKQIKTSLTTFTIPLTALFHKIRGKSSSPMHDFNTVVMVIETSEQRGGLHHHHRKFYKNFLLENISILGNMLIGAGRQLS